LRNVTAPPPERFCPACGRSFVSDRRRIWCSDACRQCGFRLRRQPADEAPLLLPRRLPKDANVSPRVYGLVFPDQTSALDPSRTSSAGHHQAEGWTEAWARSSAGGPWLESGVVFAEFGYVRP
jgi:hypothetical protein